MRDSLKIKLVEPFQFGSQFIDELEMQPPKAKHIRNMPAAPNTGDILNLAGKLCGQPPSVIDELGMEDTMKVLEVVGNFMQAGPKTGSKVSGP